MWAVVLFYAKHKTLNKKRKKLINNLIYLNQGYNIFMFWYMP